MTNTNDKSKHKTGWNKNKKPFSMYYRVGRKFSDTWNVLFVVNWFISNFFWGNTKWKKVSSPHYLKILMKLIKHGISYNLKRDPSPISKITFYANLSVSPIDTELWDFFQTKTAVSFSDQQYLKSEWGLLLILQRQCSSLKQLKLHINRANM